MTRTTNARVAGVTYVVYFLAGIASMALGSQARATSLLTLVMSFSALVLGVTLYALTRDQDADLAMIALTCRVLEGAPGDGTIFFAVSSTIFSWLLLRGHLIPRALAQLGVTASVLLAVVLPLQQAGLFGGPMAWSSSITWLVWLPMLAFELTFAGWLIVRGVAPAHHPGTLERGR